MGLFPELDLVVIEGEQERSWRGVGVEVCRYVPVCVASGAPSLGQLSLVGSIVDVWVWVIGGSLLGWVSIPMGCRGV